MMGKLVLVAILLVVASCGVLKNKKSEKETVFSVADYAYIEAFHEGLRLKARREVSGAIAAFEHCLTLKQDDDAVYYALSQLYLQKNNLAKSAEYIQQAAKIDQKNIWYTQELAYMFAESGKFANATIYFEKLVTHSPQNVEWLYGYAECLMQTGKIPEAIKILDKTEDQVGVYPELSIQKFQLYVQNKQLEKGIAEIEKAQKIYPDDKQLIATMVDYYLQTGKEDKAVSFLQELVRVSPENGRAHIALADFHRKKGNKIEAYKSLKNGFKCDDLDIDTKMKVLLSIYETTRKTDAEVYELIQLLLDKHPANPKGYSIHGDFLLRDDRQNEALKAYQSALKHDKTQYPIWNQVLLLLYQSSDFETLFAESNTCLEYFPTIPTVYLLNGVSAIHLKLYDNAIRVLEAGMDYIINDKKLEAEFFGQLGDAYFGKKQAEKGKDSYQKALGLDPTSSLLKNNFSYRLALAKMDLTQALKLINDALESNGGLPIPHYLDTKGFVLFQMGEYKSALPLFLLAVEKDPNDNSNIEHLGDAYIQLGEVDKALECWGKAKQLGSKNKVLDKKIDKKNYYEPVY